MQVGHRAPTEQEAISWLLEHVRLSEDGCRIWAGAVQRNGYPIVGWQNKKHTARRLLLQLLGHKVGPKKVVYDLCGNRKCMNPEHLRVGTKTAACAAKRADKPTQNSQMSLRVALAKAKRARLPITERHNVLAAIARGESYRVIGERYGVTDGAVGHALRAWERALGPAMFWKEAA